MFGRKKIAAVMIEAVEERRMLSGSGHDARPDDGGYHGGAIHMTPTVKSGKDDAANHNANDDKGVDPAGHVANDDNGVDVNHQRRGRGKDDVKKA